MIVLAGELAKAKGDYQAAFAHYERLLRSFIGAKQKAAEQFAASFAPKTRFGLFLRNQMSKALEWPLMAELVLGRSLIDKLKLPECKAP